jgi:hypothetical protein
MAQTAVDWLIKIYLQTNKIDNFDLEVAKVMEKENIIEAVKYGDVRGKLETYLTAEQYYSETYEGKNNS